ncbi:MAG: sodium/solute symporter [Opitutaceae bacterium]|nr:sodium/solute symporter [Opitutaceae bacterium]
MSLQFIDLAVIAAYFAVIAGIGIYATRGPRTSEQYFVAGRSIPMWAVSFTIMATIISTGTFVGHPGTAYQKGLILLVPHLLVPVVLLVVARVVVPFYRRVVRMSAYEYVGQRFGIGGRFYTSFGFLADRIFDLGVTLVTTALAINVLTGWELKTVIVGVGAFTILYTMAGGMTAVVWTDVVQGVILMVGGLFVLGRLMFAPEAGAPFAVVGETWRAGKLTLGSWDWSWRSLTDPALTTTWLFSLAYAVQWTRRYATDQHIVQRYLVAESDEAASRAAFVSASLCVPVFVTFMFAGACLAGFFQLAHVPPPPVPDSAMPYFLAHYMPAGLLGLVVAAILAAAMSTVSADLSSVGTVLTTDYFAFFVPDSSDRARMLCGRVMIILGGALTVVAAWLLLPDKDSAPLMERVIMIASILSGGTLGLFCLGFLTRTATRRGCYIGMAACIVFTAWAILTEPRNRALDLGFNFPLNPILIGLGSHVVLFATGWLASRAFGGHVPSDVDRLTVYGLKAYAGTARPEPVEAGRA